MTFSFCAESEVERIALGLLNRSLPKPEWTHAAHFAAALWILRYRPETDMRAAISAYNEATGGLNTDTAGYHETITLASMRAAKTFLERHPKMRPLHEIANLIMSSELGRPNWLGSYWSDVCLLSVEARRSWVEPDLAALPF